MFTDGPLTRLFGALFCSSLKYTLEVSLRDFPPKSRNLVLLMRFDEYIKLLSLNNQLFGQLVNLVMFSTFLDGDFKKQTPL